MRLETRDGRSESSASFRGIVQEADRAAVRGGQARPRDQGGMRHLPFHAAPVGAGHPQQWLY